MPIITAAHWCDISPDEWPARFFSPQEVADSRDGSVLVDVDTLLAADFLRIDINRPMIINSWYRTPEHDAAIGGALVHTSGKGLDVSASGELAFLLVSRAPRFGFTGIGVSQKGPHAHRFIHLDTIAPGGDHPRPWVWSY